MTEAQLIKLSDLGTKIKNQSNKVLHLKQQFHHAYVSSKSYYKIGEQIKHEQLILDDLMKEMRLQCNVGSRI